MYAAVVLVISLHAHRLSISLLIEFSKRAKHSEKQVYPVSLFYRR